MQTLDFSQDWACVKVKRVCVCVCVRVGTPVCVCFACVCFHVCVWASEPAVLFKKAFFLAYLNCSASSELSFNDWPSLRGWLTFCVLFFY